MKKIILLLATALFIACSYDDDEKIDYIDNSLIEGAWYWKQTSVDSSVYIFKGELCTMEYWEVWPTPSKGSSHTWTYKLTKDYFILNDKGKVAYKLNGNKLSIENLGEFTDFTKVE